LVVPTVLGTKSWTIPRPAASTDDLSQVREVEFQPGQLNLSHQEAIRQTFEAVARIRRLNAKEPDSFLEAVSTERPDLASLPFARGDTCRLKDEHKLHLLTTVFKVRRLLGRDFSASRSWGDLNAARAVDFWNSFTSSISVIAWQHPVTGKLTDKSPVPSQVGMLTQILAAEPAPMRLGLVMFLSPVPYAEATRALGRLAIFSPEKEVRMAAVHALRGRQESEFADLLLEGMRYPWPDVAAWSAEALVNLKRHDLLPQLVNLLDEPDPRAPVLQEVNQKKVPVARDLVRINHHRNCLLCHPLVEEAPRLPSGDLGSRNANRTPLTAPIPKPGEPLPSFAVGYYEAQPANSLLVRFDVTYLRQDFSALLPVKNAAPWPEMQRFDFLVRTRRLTEEEAENKRELFGRWGPNRLSPYHQAALTALRGLTGKDAGPTAEPWRRLLRAMKADQPAGSPLEPGPEIKGTLTPSLL
jgi:hypothetical protein